jgi:hypothetical protein
VGIDLPVGRVFLEDRVHLVLELVDHVRVDGPVVDCLGDRPAE